MTLKLNLAEFRWINEPQQFSLEQGRISITTDPNTDFWQRTYYGFRNDNAHSYIIPIAEEEFSLTVRTAFNSKKLFDQCGVLIYQDSENWFKASVEYEDESCSKLGCVVTNLGYSDWSSTDIASAQKSMFFRLSRRGQDFLAENSLDGVRYKQMRMFHLHRKLDAVNIGIYACSPLDSSMTAVFTDLVLEDCRWESYVHPD
jgi:uncharacterized protein